MKKFIIIVEIILLILILAKVTSVFGLLKKTDISSDTSLITTQAMAQQSAEIKTAPVSAAVTDSSAQLAVAIKEKDTLDENMIKQRDLAAALLTKKLNWITGKMPCGRKNNDC